MDDDQAHMQKVTHEGLITILMTKNKYLVQTEQWKQKSMKEEKIIAFSAEETYLKE